MQIIYEGSFHRMKTTKMSKEFIEIGNGKVVISFDPPAIGKLHKSIITGECCIVENSRTVHLTSNQSEKLIETNFLH